MCNGQDQGPVVRGVRVGGRESYVDLQDFYGHGLRHFYHLPHFYRIPTEFLPHFYSIPTAFLPNSYGLWSTAFLPPTALLPHFHPFLRSTAHRISTPFHGLPHFFCISYGLGIFNSPDIGRNLK
ncbi:hypothetical protein JTB14_023890 [Gonioctena quinquepunctata]|nr:hypothetical protein JTB14_023890 [Gonioctena quinquepunctata]